MSDLDLTGDIGTHDPTIVQEGGRYYRFSTGPGIPIAVSDDLRSWTMAGRVFSANPAWTQEKVPGSTDFWAPEVVYRHGRWRVYYSVSTFGSPVSAIGLVSSPTLDPSRPDYRWEDEGLVLASAPGMDFNAIDAAVASDAEGYDWILWGSFWGGLKLRRLDNQSGKPFEAAPEVHTIAHRRFGENSVEGGYILERGGWYYLFCSFDFCCRGMDSTYRIAVGRSRTITGPYLDRQGQALDQGGGTILRDGEGDPRYRALGHNSILRDGATDYLVCHAYDRRRNGAPVLAIEALEWDQDGWPRSLAQERKPKAG